MQGGTGHCARWHGGSTLLNLRENPSCKLLCQPSRINLVFLILPVLPVLLSAHVVFVNIFIVDVVVVYSQAGELCFQKAFMAKLIYNISRISSATNTKRNLFSSRGRILCVREVRYDPKSILDLFWPEVSSTLFQRYHLHSSLRSRLFWPSPDIARIEISEEGRGGLSLKGSNYFSISRRSTRCRKNPPPRPLFSPRTLYFALHTNSFKTQRSVGADSIFVIRIQWSLITSRGDKG